MEILRNPRNVGALEGADGRGEVQSSEDGDIIVIYIKVQDNVITDVTFQTFGCSAAIAVGCMLTELARGKSVDEAGQITPRDVVDALGGIPEWKMECSNIATQALQNAIFQYKEQAGQV